MAVRRESSIYSLFSSAWQISVIDETWYVSPVGAQTGFRVWNWLPPYVALQEGVGQSCFSAPSANTHSEPFIGSLRGTFEINGPVGTHLWSRELVHLYKYPWRAKSVTEIRPVPSISIDSSTNSNILINKILRKMIKTIFELKPSDTLLKS